MPQVIIQSYTTKDPISLIGTEAGVCWGADTADTAKNYKRGIECLDNEHGRTFEFPDVYMILDGYSARVIREWYTHVGGAPTRLQASTRYINYQKGFDYVTPPKIEANAEAKAIYDKAMNDILDACQRIEALGVPREDNAMLLPLGMTTKIVCKHNLRNLLDMSRQRMCTRAYHEYRRLFNDILKALADYSEEWKYLAENYFMAKCDKTGFCTERYSCGRHPKKEK